MGQFDAVYNCDLTLVNSVSYSNTLLSIAAVLIPNTIYRTGRQLDAQRQNQRPPIGGDAVSAAVRQGA